MARIAVRFRRVERRATARAFILGLLSGVERKNCRQLAEEAGHARPGAMQRLLRSARWDADGVRDEVRQARSSDHRPHRRTTFWPGRSGAGSTRHRPDARTTDDGSPATRTPIHQPRSPVAG
ncbi:transposase [Streptomyces sp. NPDC056704]|uniref:transposase n=1 Tax=Streptomyces sp. NPDC056704 TaxID=3345917 RepID=UPI0036C5DCF5